MGSLSSSMILYLVFLFIAFVTATVFWIRGTYRIGAALSLIFSLLAPLLTIIIAAQRVSAIGVYDYVIGEMQLGNIWARVLVIIHIYLIVWLVFLLAMFVMKVVKSPAVKAKIQRLISKMKNRKIEHKEENQSRTGQ